MTSYYDSHENQTLYMYKTKIQHNVCRIAVDWVSCYSLGITVFHDAAIPPDDFVANCTIPFEDLIHRDKDATDFWVSAVCTQNTVLMTDS